MSLAQLRHDKKAQKIKNKEASDGNGALNKAE